MEKKLSAPGLGKVKITEPFFGAYDKLVRDRVIPYQWQVLNDLDPDAEPSYSIRNLKIAAGLIPGEFDGRVFQDSDTYKWLEAVGYSLQASPNPETEKNADYVIDILEKAQREDGYLNSYYIINGLDKRWTNVRDNHELYCAGHFIEAAAAYYTATGKKKVLDIACRLADHIDSVFGPEENKLHGYPGHQEIELALVKLYKITNNKKYLSLAAYFINERGKAPYFFTDEMEKYGSKNHWKGIGDTWDYYQAHKPVTEQESAVGHAVRAAYMYTGMADVAYETGDGVLLDACRKLWDDITQKQMYITGGIGSSSVGERFTIDYDLPLDTMYNETCASIALIFFAQRMLQIERDAKYADTIELALYNTVLAGMSDDGTKFFYVNPLESWPERSKRNGTYSHVLPTRPKWFSCACCPPNVARLIASLGEYAYSYDSGSIYVNLYIGCGAEFPLSSNVSISSKGAMPWSGDYSLKINSGGGTEFALKLRRPSWSKGFAVKLNGKEISGTMDKGYFTLSRVWQDGDEITVTMAMETEFIRGNPQMRSMIGKLCIKRGPIVYCAEQADNGENLFLHHIKHGSNTKAGSMKTGIGDVVTLKVESEKLDSSVSASYYSEKDIKFIPSELTLVPYFAWAGRDVGEMQVFFQEKQEG